MTTISSNILKAKKTKTEKTTFAKISIWERYLAYADSKANEGIIWYLKSIILVPCVFMVFSITAMAVVTPNYIWFVGLTMVLFFFNLIAHIGDTKSRFYIPLYHASILIMSIIPFITYLLS